MLKFFSKRMNKKGFTLIELIVVIAILGILLLIAIPRLAGFRESAARRADKASAATIGNAVALYYADKGAPSSEVTIIIKNNMDTEYEEIENMVKESESGGVPVPQYNKATNTNFGAKVDIDGSVKVYYSTSDTITNEMLWPEGTGASN